MRRLYYKWFPAWVVILTVVGTSSDVLPNAKTAPEQNQCVICHTSVKGLIRLSWQVEKTRPPKAQSSETIGEG